MEKRVFQKGARTTGYPHVKYIYFYIYINIDTDLSHFPRITQQILDLNVKYRTMKNLGDVGFGSEFLDATPKHHL